jgi:hypothetical protein
LCEAHRLAPILPLTAITERYAMTNPVCFMVMPFGEKPTQLSGGKGPVRIDFDALWEKALSPLIRDLGYEPVRADKDLGALIIKEMIERLTLADLVVADVTVPNANVYYEIGVRHAAQESGCVLISAEWASPVFDLAQMRQMRYPLPEGRITDATAEAVRAALEKDIAALAEGKSPIFAAVPGFPKKLDPQSADSFRRFVEELSGFQAKVRAVRATASEERAARALALREEFAGRKTLVPAVAVELMQLLRDCAGWEPMLEFIDALPEPLRRLPIVEEQRCLAVSKTGKPQEAIGLLEELIKTGGESSERRGLLGGRYKWLFDRATTQGDRLRYLDLAIEHYELGMYLDLNDYYPTSNLPRLYRIRGDEGDEDRARMAAAVTLAACERAKRQGSEDEWLNPTLLGAAFDAGDVTAAKRLYRQVAKTGYATWKLDTTLRDLERSVAALGDEGRRQALQPLLNALKGLLP